MAFIAGAFTATYDSSTIGQTEAGFNIEYTVRKRLITGDNHAETPQDAVFRGHEVFVSMTLLEWNATNAAGAFWPYAGAVGNQGAGASNTVGKLDVGGSLAKALVLTAVAGTSADGLTAENVYTFDRAILAEGFPVNILLAPDLRTVPLRMRIYPNASGVFWAAS